jgi:hypothetical protein
MPDLEHTLQGHDLGFMKIIAGGWGIDLNAPDTVTALPVLVNGILEHSDFVEVIEALPGDARSVLQGLLQNDGRMAWAAFVRKYGDIRRMGPARRDRERPDLKPATAVEVLWYRGLLGRAFLALPPATEPQEYAYIPEDLLPLLPSLHSDMPPPLGRPATPVEAAHAIPAGDQILDHACTLLAALRLKLSPQVLAQLDLGGIPPAALTGLLRAANLLDQDDLPHPERTRDFLEAPRGKALAQLVKGWMEDPQFNELRLLPGLKFEGDWQNDALHTRQFILELVGQIPQERWWGLAAFVSAIRDQHPDFQRPAGDYDSWFIRQEKTGAYLRGFGVWDEVDGALLRYMITGPMHWLGMLDLAAPEPGAAPTGLRLSAWAEALWNASAPDGLPKETARIKASSDGRLWLPALFPRAARYQVARFCEWGSRADPAQYSYRITPAALERAKAQGLRASQLISLLRRYHDGPLPPSIVQGLEHWESAGTQALIEHVTLLRVTLPEILTTLRKTRAARCLGDALNETTVVIRPGMEDQVLAALFETGYLAQAKLLASQD